VSRPARRPPATRIDGPPVRSGPSWPDPANVDGLDLIGRHGGTLAAHASLVARKHTIPAVIGTGDASVRRHAGQVVTVDGSTGTVTPHAEPECGSRKDEEI
jgi:phosphoenolpyruvate-protein kinase (PTS system EI component)